jgi:thiamine kinase-like enzyme
MNCVCCTVMNKNTAPYNSRKDRQKGSCTGRPQAGPRAAAGDAHVEKVGEYKTKIFRQEKKWKKARKNAVQKMESDCSHNDSDHGNGVLSASSTGGRDKP